MHSKTSIILAATIGLGLTACATHRMDVAWPEPRPLGKDFTTYRPPHQPPAAASPPLQLREPIGVITLRQVLPLALMKNPELVTFSWEVRAREARTLQTALLPNPELSTVMEDVGGSGAFSGLSQAETTIALSQLIELGGKRSKRTRVASLTRDLAGWDYETKRIELLTQVSQAFIDVLGAQERLVRTEELVRLAEQVALTTSERVKAGKVSPIEETRANAAFSLARIELDRAERALEASRKRLAATWGSTSPHFERLEGELDFVSPIPSLEQLAQRLTQTRNSPAGALRYLSARQLLISKSPKRFRTL